MQQRRSPKIDFRENFGVVQSPTFATISANNRHRRLNGLGSQNVASHNALWRPIDQHRHGVYGLQSPRNAKTKISEGCCRIVMFAALRLLDKLEALHTFGRHRVGESRGDKMTPPAKLAAVTAAAMFRHQRSG
jgi:hypothetical protein